MIKKMPWALFSAALLLAAAALWTPARAIVIGFDPAAQTVAPGSMVDVALTISDLGDFAPPSLGIFDMDVAFDPAILDPAIVVFGTELDLFGLGSIQDVVSVGPGVLNLFELSVDLPADLDALQAGAFTLATLTFDALAVGASPLNVAIIDLGDSFGDPLDATVTGGSITVAQASTPIPEPSTILLFGVGLAGLGFFGWGRRRAAQIHAA